MISCRHNLFDDRIYKKESLTLAKNGYEVVHIAYGDEDLDFVSDDNIRLIQKKYLKKGNTIKSRFLSLKQTFLMDLFQLAKATKADVYHLHDVELCRIALKLKKLPWKPKIIYDAHEPYLDVLIDYWKKYSLAQNLLINTPAVLAERRILKKVDALIATESNVASRFARKNKNTFTIYNYSYFNPEVYKQQDGQKLYDLVYCGGMTESKGIFLMLEALICAKQKGYDLKMVLIGNPHIDPIVEKKIKQIIKKEGLENSVVFTGELPLEQISDYYNKSKIGLCLFPKNRVTKLILPIKIFEYISFGLPVIGSDFGHIKEIIEQDALGLSVNPHDSQKVSWAFIELLKNDRYEKYVQKCINVSKKKYLWTNQETRLLGIYDKFFSE